MNWEVLANIGGNRGYLGSCALEALPNIRGGRGRKSGRMVAMWSVLASVALEKEPRMCLDDRFVFVLARRGRFDG
jgi:hypothetical protein